MAVSGKVVKFYEKFRAPSPLPNGVQIHNPFADSQRRVAITDFCMKFYDDNRERTHLIGINPSRLTATSSGVNYTDGYALEEICGIPNEFVKTRELTSRFFYMAVEAIGGAYSFYGDVFAWAAMPMSITEGGDYKNYYDERMLDLFTETVVQNLNWMAKNIPSNGRLVVLGTGKNKEIIEGLSDYPFGYGSVKFLPHPRWIMQYNSHNADKYIGEYADALR